SFFVLSGARRGGTLGVFSLPETHGPLSGVAFAPVGEIRGAARRLALAAAHAPRRVLVRHLLRCLRDGADLCPAPGDRLRAGRLRAAAYLNKKARLRVGTSPGLCVAAGFVGGGDGADGGGARTQRPAAIAHPHKASRFPERRLLKRSSGRELRRPLAMVALTETKADRPRSGGPAFISRGQRWRK